MKYTKRFTNADRDEATRLATEYAEGISEYYTPRVEGPFRVVTANPYELPRDTGEFAADAVWYTWD